MERVNSHRPSFFMILNLHRSNLTLNPTKLCLGIYGALRSRRFSVEEAQDYPKHMLERGCRADAKIPYGAKLDGEQVTRADSAFVASGRRKTCTRSKETAKDMKGG